MGLDRSLLEIAKLLLSERETERTAEIVLNHVLQATNAERGFIVVRDEESFSKKLDVRFDRDDVSNETYRFSRSLVRRVIESGQIVELSDVLQDQGISAAESLAELSSCSVLAAPLRAGNDVYGVVYLQGRARPEGFSTEDRAFVAEFAEIAGLSLQRAIERDALQRRNESLERDLFARHDFQGIVTRHPRMLELLETVAQVADSDSTILLLGETGTGKELIARALHANSSRRAKPFVTLHCKALPGTILESELFGHVRGAFTGADRDRPGRIASAAGGTLLLDEVAELSSDIQVTLLRFLQYGEIQRLGSDRVEKVDVRIVAATHQDLPALVSQGKFRQDLYYRLNVLELRIPPLRDRRSDIPLLVDHFLRKFWRRPGDAGQFTARAQQALRTHPYPGNVRELEHLVERACLLARGSQLDIDLLPAELAVAAAEPSIEFSELSNDELKGAKQAAVAAIERRFLQALMERWEGNVTRAAKASGIYRSQLQRLLAAHGLGTESPVGAKKSR